MAVETPTLPTRSLAREFHESGFAVARQLFDAREVAEIQDVFMQTAKDGPVAGISETLHHVGGDYSDNDPLKRYPRMMHPHRHPESPVGPVAMRYMLDRRLHAILRELMGEEPWAAQSMFYFKPPGARGQDLHQDNFYLRVKPGTCVAAWIAIDRADEDNGGMMCVPGTHNMELVCPEEADSSKFFTTHHVEPPPGLKPQIVVMDPGDVLFFNGSVIHGSFPNTSRDRFRRSLICHYVPASTAEMNQTYQVIDFNGKPRPIAHVTDGGPCGTPQAAPH